MLPFVSQAEDRVVFIAVFLGSIIHLIHYTIQGLELEKIYKELHANSGTHQQTAATNANQNNVLGTTIPDLVQKDISAALAMIEASVQDTSDWICERLATASDRDGFVGAGEVNNVIGYEYKRSLLSRSSKLEEVLHLCRALTASLCSTAAVTGK
jgi:hypothetical protein